MTAKKDIPQASPEKGPAFDVGATPSVVRRIAKGLPKGLGDAWLELLRKLKANPRFVTVDKKVIWGKAWADVPNHRHTDLPGAWRATWTIRATDGKEMVTVLFLGPHKEYEEMYGFKKH